METLLGLFVGIGLSAACGFRIFVPLLGMSIASMTGHLQLSAGFDWIGTWPALIAFSAATTLEVGAYYVPWVDHLLDAVATPTAIVAGTLVTASMVGDISPFLKWSLAAIAGGGVAGTVQLGTVATRGASLVATGGGGNFVVSTMELAISVLMTVFAIVVPVICLIAVAWLCFKMVKRVIASPFLRRQKGPSNPRDTGDMKSIVGFENSSRKAVAATPPPPSPSSGPRQ